MVRLSAKDYHVGWICALSVELAAAKAMLDEDHGPITDQDKHDSNRYVLGKVHDHNVVLACLPSGVDGTNAAAIVATNMLRTFREVRIGLLVGIGGGIPDQDNTDIRLGDIVISMPTRTNGGVVQYDKGKTLADGSFELKGSLNAPPSVLLTALSSIRAEHDMGDSRVSHYLSKMYHDFPKMARSGYVSPGPEQDHLHCSHCTLPNESCEYCHHGELFRPSRGQNDPEFHYGTIASGNHVIKNAAERDLLRKQFGAICVEMEAAGLMNDFPCLVVRGICDYADPYKNDKWQKYAAGTAAAAAKEILFHVSPLSTEREEPIVNIVDIIKWQRQVDERACLIALKTSAYGEHKDVNPARTDGTCQWVLQHTRYIDWMQRQHDDLLWISADPGCGKSVLAKSLVDREVPSSGSHTVCYFFFKDNPEQEGLATALCALLHQLFSQQRLLIRHAVDAWKLSGDSFLKEVQELWHIFVRAATDPMSHHVTCVLDALDECNDKDQHQLITLLNDFYTAIYSTSSESESTARSHALKFLVTSRPYDAINSRFAEIPSGLPTIRLKGEDESERIHQEIDIVIRHRVATLARHLSLKQTTRATLETKLLNMEHRTYLWLYLAFDEIKKAYQNSLRPDKVLIEAVPVSVEDAYAKILSKVDANHEETVKKIFQIVVGAVRPLTIAEMAIALGLGTSQDQVSLEDAVLEGGWVEDRIRNWCGLFISFNQSRIYLIHQTAKEFLISKSDLQVHKSGWKYCLSSTDIESVMVKICVDFLYLYEQALEKRLQVPPASKWTANDAVGDIAGEQIEFGAEYETFLQYAAVNWSRHLQYARLPKERLIIDKLVKLHHDTKSSFYTRWMSVVINDYQPATRTEWRPVGIHRYNAELNGLHAAVITGSVDVVQRVLEQKVYDIHSKDYMGRTALTYACEFGRVEVANLLIKEGASVETPVFDHLHIATNRNNIDIVQILLDNGAEINLKNVRSETALHIAITMGYEEIATLLVHRGAHLQLADSQGESPLYKAAKGGYEKIVEMLLSRQVSPNMGPKSGWPFGEYRSPLHAASKGGHAATIRLLLRYGADINMMDSHGHTALYDAAAEGHAKIVEMLLVQGADVDISDKEDRTPLHVASEGGYIPIVELLLRYGAQIDVVSKVGQTPLYRACSGCHQEVVKILLQHHADVNTIGIDGETLLHLAAYKGQANIVKLLLVSGCQVYVSTQDNDGETPLHTAYSQGHKSIVELLLEYGARTDVLDWKKRTPLGRVKLEGQKAVADARFFDEDGILLHRLNVSRVGQLDVDRKTNWI